MTALNLILLGGAAALVFLITLSVCAVWLAMPRSSQANPFGLKRDR